MYFLVIYIYVIAIIAVESNLGRCNPVLAVKVVTHRVNRLKPIDQVQL